MEGPNSEMCSMAHILHMPHEVSLLKQSYFFFYFQGIGKFKHSWQTYLPPKKCKNIPSRKLTYPQKWHFEDDFPFPKVGYVNPLEGTQKHPKNSFFNVFCWIEVCAGIVWSLGVEDTARLAPTCKMFGQETPSWAHKQSSFYRCV